MPKKKVVCEACGGNVSVVEKAENYYSKGVEKHDVIKKFTCKECGYEWETKSGS